MELKNINFSLDNNLTRFLRQSFNPDRTNKIKPPINLRPEDQVDYLRGLEIYLSVCYSSQEEPPINLTEKECYFTAVVGYDWNDLTPLIKLCNFYAKRQSNKVDDGLYWFWLAKDDRFWQSFPIEMYRRKTYSQLKIVKIDRNIETITSNKLTPDSYLDSDGKILVKVTDNIFYRTKQLTGSRIRNMEDLLKLGNIAIAGNHISHIYNNTFVYYNLKGPLPIKIQEALTLSLRGNRRTGTLNQHVVDFISYLRTGDLETITNKGYEQYINLNDPEPEIKRYLWSGNLTNKFIKRIENDIYYVYEVPVSNRDIFIYGDVELVDVLDNINDVLGRSNNNNPLRLGFISYESHPHYLIIKDYRISYTVHKIKFNNVNDILAYMDVDSHQILAYYDQEVKIIATEAYVNSLFYDRNLVIPTHQSSDYNQHLVDSLPVYPDYPSDMTSVMDFNLRSKPDEQRTYRGIFEILDGLLVTDLDTRLDFINHKHYLRNYSVHRLTFTKFVVDLSSGIITNALDFSYISYFEGQQKYEYPNLLEMELGKYLPPVLLGLITKLENIEEDELQELHNLVELSS